MTHSPHYILEFTTRSVALYDTSPQTGGIALWQQSLPEHTFFDGCVFNTTALTQVLQSCSRIHSPSTRALFHGIAPMLSTTTPSLKAACAFQIALAAARANLPLTSLASEYGSTAPNLLVALNKPPHPLRPWLITTGLFIITLMSIFALRIYHTHTRLYHLTTTCSTLENACNALQQTLSPQTSAGSLVHALEIALNDTLTGLSSNSWLTSITCTPHKIPSGICVTVMGIGATAHDAASLISTMNHSPHWSHVHLTSCAEHTNDASSQVRFTITGTVQPPQN